jgi:hypothetical protein
MHDADFHVATFLVNSGQEFSKILILAPESSLDALSELLRGLAPDAHLVRGFFFIEVLHPRVNKGAGLIGLCEKLNVCLRSISKSLDCTVNLISCFLCTETPLG